MFSVQRLPVILPLEEGLGHGHHHEGVVLPVPDLDIIIRLRDTGNSLFDFLQILSRSFRFSDKSVPARPCVAGLLVFPLRAVILSSRV